MTKEEFTKEELEPTEEERVIMEACQQVLESYEDGGLLAIPYQITMIGDAEGQYFLGWLHYVARADLPNGYMKNNVMSYAWLTISVNNGYTRSEELRDIVEATLSEVEKRVARAVVLHWIVEKLQGKFKS